MRAVTERKRRYRRFLLIALVLALLGGGVYGCRHLEASGEAAGRNVYQIECSTRSVMAAETGETERPRVRVCGAPVGIYMETEGVLIIDAGEIQTMDGQKSAPADNIVQPGDYIQEVDGRTLENKNQLIRQVAESQGKPMGLDVMRHGEPVELQLTPVLDSGGAYKLGIWVRDNIQGIGTMTYVEADGSFGALGHGISDVDVGEILQVGAGELYQADILSVVKGQDGSPGELQGVIHYYPGDQIGEITDNSRVGIYGKLYGEAVEALPLKTVEIGWKQEVEPGPATVLCSADGKVSEYDIEVTEIDWSQQDTNKCFTIRVTDPELLEQTGGIVQGMSGSPILQNGRLIGAVTHVFVSDAASGYGIFIENMLQH